jgi:hypothetical protein
MRKRLNESYDLIYAAEQKAEERQQKELNDRAQDSQVGNG